MSANAIPCDFQPTGEFDAHGRPYHVCARCGRRWAFQRIAQIACKKQSLGLGDVVAAAIKWLTGGRVKPCGGCKERQAKLNRLGERLRPSTAKAPRRDPLTTDH
jgi:hypothetical protein